ncbi:MAG: polymer-forming cytoskeletal protein [Pyrinomonadaceae bacterium]|jgi:cytoskeletal protein CcmA (bactofilin family)
MIRMGRNAKPEQSDSPEYQTTAPVSASSLGYGLESTNTVSRPATDSENIARDIKEGKLSGFVGHGTSLTGDTTFQMMLRVDGHLTGTVSSDGGTLIVGNNGRLDANVSVGVANVNGTINGDITATEKIHLGRTARVVGNISTPKLVIEEGAIFEGGCTMLKERESQEKQSAAQTQSSYSSSSYSSASSYSSTASATSSLSADDDDDKEDEQKTDSATV